MAPFFLVSNCRALLCAFDSVILDLLLDLTTGSLRRHNALQPVKRRRALLASNPLRNSRLETHRDDEGAALGPPSSFFSSIVAIDFPMPQKTP